MNTPIAGMYFQNNSVRIPVQWTLILSTIQRLISDQAVLAGGAVRDLFHAKPIKDLDFFVPSDALNAEKARMVAEHLGMQLDASGMDLREYQENLNGVEQIYTLEPDTNPSEDTFGQLDAQPIQIIGLDFMEPCLARIDWSLCQVAWCGGDQFVSTVEYRVDHKASRFTLMRDNPDELLRSLNRMARFREKYPNHKVCVPPSLEDHEYWQRFQKTGYPLPV